MSLATSISLSSIPKERWDKVPAARRTPMRQYIWAKSYQETLAKGEVWAIFVGSASDPVAIAPFATPVSGPGCSVLLGAEDLWESIEVTAEDERALRELAELIANCGKPLRFGHHPTDTQFLDYLTRACRRKAYVVSVMQPTRAMPRIELDPSWIEPESHFNSRRRSDFRRMARKANELGEVTFDIIEPDAGQIDDLLAEAFAVEARNWKGQSGTAINQDAKTQSFYRDYARRAADEGMLRLCFMRIDQVPAAMQFAVECEDAFWLIKVGYDERFKQISPGNLLLRETIRYAAQKGLRSYEFMGKEAQWTKLWAGDARPIATLRTYPYNLAGLSAFVSDGMALMRKRLAERIAAVTGRKDA